MPDSRMEESFVFVLERDHVGIRFISAIYFGGALVIFELLAYPLLEKYAAHLDFCHRFEIWILEVFLVLIGYF